MRLYRGLCAAFVSLFLVTVVAACGSDDTPAVDTWESKGATGSISVTPPSGDTAPKISVSTPYSVTETQVHVLTEGSGAVVADTAEVRVNYLGVNGRDGQEFDSSYGRGTPAEFPLNGVIPGFSKAIAGQKVGSTVVVSIAPADGYTSGQPSAGIQAGDTLVFVIEILDVVS
ncbi:FKBP-type peptidyl-prolyl cis-trans isomerase [Gordonia sp. NB41Y]|uniref:FKBP-type peptidyl-prolyl cis-trans isomerase n=1 Tax=Gordonia sp. NB41Y TaxID=875808 RepID=UPI000345833F|nr:FKBP-type peptidyl-prolyl cis-trans isomerase [Gordonia sp. NB41Y]WLP90842.1 FKBP-type peptidyl-prolyl cis-trans isomerase [Gordonia sp. NB41Y]